MQRNLIVFMLFAVPFAVSCGRDPQPGRSTGHIRMFDDTVIRYNKGVVRDEEQEIADFMARYGWKMDRTQTGVRYMVYKHGAGPKADTGNVAVIGYSVSLLNGNLLYSSKESGFREVPIGHLEGEPGLQESILLMRTGDRMKAIVPSHLAFGLLGDHNKVPPGAVLVYDLELVRIKKDKSSK